MRVKILFKEIYNLLRYKYRLNIYDYGIDWLKFNTSFEYLNTSIQNKLDDFIDNPSEYLSSSTGNVLYDVKVDYGSYKEFFNLYFYKSPVGYTIQFQKDFSQFGIMGGKALFDITYITSFSSIPYLLINIYGLAFQLHKINIFDIEKYILTLFPYAKNTRVDFNYNLDCQSNSPSSYIKLIKQKYKYLDFNTFGDNSLQYRLYEKKGKSNNGKVKYRLTHRFGLRLYNKSKQIVDANLVGLYPQYDGKNILRLEGVLGSQYLGDLYFSNTDLFKNHKNIFSYKTLDDLFSYVHNLVLGNESLINYKNSNGYKIYYLDKILNRSASDIGSRIETYIERGGKIDNIIVGGKKLTDYILEYLPETYFV